MAEFPPKTRGASLCGMAHPPIELQSRLVPVRRRTKSQVAAVHDRRPRLRTEPVDSPSRHGHVLTAGGFWMYDASTPLVAGARLKPEGATKRAPWDGWPSNCTGRGRPPRRWQCVGEGIVPQDRGDPRRRSRSKLQPRRPETGASSRVACVSDLLNIPWPARSPWFLSRGRPTSHGFWGQTGSNGVPDSLESLIRGPRSLEGAALWCELDCVDEPATTDLTACPGLFLGPDMTMRNLRIVDSFRPPYYNQHLRLPFDSPRHPTPLPFDFFYNPTPLPFDLFYNPTSLPFDLLQQPTPTPFDSPRQPTPLPFDLRTPPHTPVNRPSELPPSPDWLPGGTRRLLTPPHRCVAWKSACQRRIFGFGTTADGITPAHGGWNRTRSRE
ncbi:unnamed protein product [Diplocarpon coronariae]